MKNRNKKEEKRKVFTGEKKFDYTAVKENPREQMLRALEPMHEINDRPLKTRLTILVTTTPDKAKNLVMSVYACGFTFRQSDHDQFKVVPV